MCCGPASLQALATSRDNPMLLAETPLGGAEQKPPCWEALAPELEELASSQLLRARPQSAPTTPATAPFTQHRTADAHAEPAVPSAANEQLFKQAAALASALEQLRLQLQRGTDRAAGQQPVLADQTHAVALQSDHATVLATAQSPTGVGEQALGSVPSHRALNRERLLDIDAAEAVGVPDLASMPARLQRVALRQRHLTCIHEEPCEAMGNAGVPIAEQQLQAGNNHGEETPI